MFNSVATALTVYGIETLLEAPECFAFRIFKLQQPLPFTVLKRYDNSVHPIRTHYVATALTVYGIETTR